VTILLHDTVPFLVHRIAASFNGWSTDFKPFGLNVLSARVMVVLHINGSATVGELTDATSLEQSTLSHILRRLTRAGMVTKKRQAHDNRSVLVRHTPKGRRIAEKCLEIVVNHEREITRGLTSEQVRALKAALQQLYANLHAAANAANAEHI
jgi:MarR family transcriptional regulator, organic hydroperoxide resistance regulator